MNEMCRYWKLGYQKEKDGKLLIGLIFCQFGSLYQLRRQLILISLLVSVTGFTLH